MNTQSFSQAENTKKTYWQSGIVCWPNVEKGHQKLELNLSIISPVWLYWKEFTSSKSLTSESQTQAGIRW